MADLISRQEAIDEIEQYEYTDSMHPGLVDAKYLFDMLRNLPSVQSTIIYCKDCKHFVRDDIEEQTPYGFYNTYFRAFCDKHWDQEAGEYIDVNTDDYCSFAEKR